MNTSAIIAIGIGGVVLGLMAWKARGKCTP